MVDPTSPPPPFLVWRCIPWMEEVRTHPLWAFPSESGEGYTVVDAYGEFAGRWRTLVMEDPYGIDLMPTPLEAVRRTLEKRGIRYQQERAKSLSMLAREHQRLIEELYGEIRLLEKALEGKETLNEQRKVPE